jgi:uncharacterized protein YkwD
MSLDKAAMEAYDKGLPYYVSYSGYEDYDVYVCTGCGDIDLGTMKFRYSDYEAAALMLGYVNELRKSAGIEQLSLDTTLMELARIEVKKYSETGNHENHGLTGNYVDGGSSIRHHFEKWNNGNGRVNMLSTTYKYFGYAICKNPHGNGHYGIQYFWDGKSPF